MKRLYSTITLRQLANRIAWQRSDSNQGTLVLRVERIGDRSVAYLEQINPGCHDCTDDRNLRAWNCDNVSPSHLRPDERELSLLCGKHGLTALDGTVYVTNNLARNR